MNDSNYQDMELEVLDNQNIEPKASNDQNVEPEALDNQDVELEVLAEYNSTNDLSDIDIDNFDDIEGFSVGKTFKNWDQKASKLEWGVLLSRHVGHELNPPARQFDLMLHKLSKEIVKEIHFLTTVAKANHDSESDEDDAEMLLKRLNEKKIEDPRWF
ncbi:9701_t:CDS:2, partial [Cetraspora pellucida]